MLNSLSIFSTKLFDYAGLFPPAQLNLSTALSNFLHYHEHACHKMLGKFIFPLTKIDEIILFFQENAHNQKILIEKKIEISGLFTKISSGKDAKEIYLKDLENLQKLLASYKSNITISSIEVLIPNDIILDKEKTFQYLKNLFNLLYKFDSNINIFFEIPILKDVPILLIDNLSSYILDNKINNVGIKLRAGGTKPDQIPSASNLSQVIIKTAEQNIPIKLTAGLHQSTPIFNSEIGTKMHGFLNVIGAILLAHTLKKSMPLKEMNDYIIDIIARYEKDQFKFTEEGLYIGKFLLVNDKLQELRQKYVKGIGTCDFIEPAESLNHYLL